jgi:hypothetical protein
VGVTGSRNLLCTYITQGRVEADRQAISLRRLTHYLLTAHDQLKDRQREIVDTHHHRLPEVTALAGLVRSFAALLTPPTTTRRN